MASTIKIGGGTILSLSEVERLIDLESVADYVLNRQNRDGGYTFCRGAESSAQDTFYAIEIMNLIGIEPRNVEKTASFLRGLQRGDGRFDSIKIAYYAFKTLHRLGFRLEVPEEYLLSSLENSLARLEEARVYADVSSEIEVAGFIVEMLEMSDVPFDSGKVASEVLRLRNFDGSFGKAGYSKLASTYYSLKTLSMLGYRIKGFKDTLNWLRRCEVPSGGFVGSPSLSPTYLVMEDTYFGLNALSLLGEKCRYPRETLNLIRKFQNPNGGFRRSIFLGISDFESTYQALSSIKVLIESL
ncbi:hypothetical protein J7L06_11070 [Candidatus Bathyarchaeota archaeon]|nr:hypothetical protein [Candidatus Bathyarchaeota archaeon]